MRRRKFIAGAAAAAVRPATLLAPRVVVTTFEELQAACAAGHRVVHIVGTILIPIGRILNSAAPTAFIGG